MGDESSSRIRLVSGSIVACPSCSTKNRVPVSVTGRPRCAGCKNDLPWIVDAVDGDFADAIDTKRLVVVDLWAPWCGPCRMIAPILEKLAGDYAGRLKIVKVNVDDNPATAQRFQAQSIPLLVFLRNGKTVASVIGAQPEATLRRQVEAHLPG